MAIKLIEYEQARSALNNIVEYLAAILAAALTLSRYADKAADITSGACEVLYCASLSTAIR